MIKQNVCSLVIMGSKSHSNNKSPGILRNHRSSHDIAFDFENKKLKIRVHDPYRVDPREADAEERRFEVLKQQYFNQCAPINRNVIQKLSQTQAYQYNRDKNDDLNQNLYKTTRFIPRAFANVEKNQMQKEIAIDRRHRNVNLKRPANENLRNMQRGCGVMGCSCLNCVCGRNCQVDCQCMRRN